MEVLLEAHGRSSEQREPPRKPAHKKAMELGRKTEREASGFGPTTLRPLYARSPLPPHLPPFIDQEGSRLGINFLPTESNYLGSTYVPNSLLYTTKDVRV